MLSVQRLRSTSSLARADSFQSTFSRAKQHWKPTYPQLNKVISLAKYTGSALIEKSNEAPFEAMSPLQRAGVTYRG